jgi:hypothetical protein
MQAAAVVTISENMKVRAITAPYFLGTKLEAFHGRGHLDYFASHDLEDLIAVVDGRLLATGAGGAYYAVTVWYESSAKKAGAIVSVWTITCRTQVYSIRSGCWLPA